MDIVIVGAGLAGLACAIQLEAAGHTVRVFEASERVGGRIGSVRRQDGFVIDRGFQVLFTRYPSVQQLLDLDALALCRFPKGALVRHQGRVFELSSPLDRPLQAWNSLCAPVITWRDLAIFARLTWEVSVTPDAVLRDGPPLGSSIDYLRSLGLSVDVIDAFLRPFFGGIFLDSQLSTDARMFRYYWKMMALGDVAIPARGMQAIPDQLAARLRPDTLKLSSPVGELMQHDGRVSGLRLLTGEEVPADVVVLATGYPELNRLGAPLPTIAGRATTTWFFASERPATPEPLIILNGEARGLINQVFPLSNVNPAYAPQGQHLLAVQVLAVPADAQSDVESLVRQELETWFPKADVTRWRMLEAVETPFAQFAAEPAVLANRPGPRLGDGLYLASELTTQSSIDGALRGGLLAADAILGRPAGV